MSLPKEKIEKLGDKLAEGLNREVRRTYKELREHEVSREDARRVIRDGYNKMTMPSEDEAK